MDVRRGAAAPDTEPPYASADADADGVATLTVLPGEACRVRRDDIDATRRMIVIRQSKFAKDRVVPVTEVPNMGHFAWFSDPEGNCIGLHSMQ